MGTIFGKQSVAEPAFKVLYEQHQHGHGTRASVIGYEIRQYGERYAAETFYKEGSNDDSPFMVLARYIGVFGTPENEGQEAISMTAPVVKENNGKPVQIAMTAPVMKSEGDDSGEKAMAFILPAEYDAIDMIPKPTNPAVHIKEIPPSVGAVHRYSGRYSDELAKQMASQLANQLIHDGVHDLTKDQVLDNYQFWGYNPPFTLPVFRRNEIWVELTEEQVDQLIHPDKYVTTETN